MSQSASPRARAVALVLALGVVAAGILVATTTDPSPTQVGAPHSLLDSPALASAGLSKRGPFYEAKPVAKGTLPGTLRRSEKIAGAPAGIRVERFVNVSETAAGVPQEVSGIFAVKEGLPPNPNGRPLITVAHGTTGVAPGCGVSMEPFREGSNDYFWWYFYVRPLVSAGYAVAMTDYGNLGVPGVSDYIVMKGAGADVLNAARAATALAPDVIDGSRMAIVGHSQGGYNALAAAYIAPSYAPELPIKGTVSMAPSFYPPTPLVTAFMESGPGGSDLSGAAFDAHLADAVTSWSENFPNQIKPSDVYTEKGLVGYQAASKTCILETIVPLTAPYDEIVKSPITANMAKIVGENMPIHHRYETPLLMQQGLEDTTVVPQATVAAYRTFCKQGTVVSLQTYPTDVHSSVMLTAMPNALNWLQNRFAGEPAPTTCH